MKNKTTTADAEIHGVEYHGSMEVVPNVEDIDTGNKNYYLL